MYSRERSVHHRVIFSTPVTTRAVARSPFDRFEKRKKVKLERRRKCWQDESGPADSKWNCALTPQAKDNNNPSNVLARAVRSCHADSFWPRALQGPFPLSLSPLTVVSARSVAQSTNSTHTHTNVISSWPPSKRTVPKRKQPDAIVQ